MVDPTAALGVIKSEKGLITQIYKDLARPGVSQVGKALGTVLGLGNTILIPLRLLNEYSRKFEEKNFEEIADRFSKIPEEEIVEISPEIGVPILDALSHTEDSRLREMFIELLGKAATQSKVDQAHPSFVSVIEALTPDEALLLTSWRDKNSHPFITLKLLNPENKAMSKQFADLICLPPKGILHTENLGFYISNLVGLGLIEIKRELELADSSHYDAIINFAKNKYNLGEKVDVGEEKEWNVDYKKSTFGFLPYGHKFIEACC